MACPCGTALGPRQRRYCSRLCSGRYVTRYPVGPRPTKVCTVCGVTFERPKGLDTYRWERRESCTVACENRRTLRGAAKIRSGRAAPLPREVEPPPRNPLATGEPGAARAGNRQAPRPVPSRDRVKPPETPPRFRLGGVPEIPAVVRSTPRPSLADIRRRGQVEPYG